MSALKFGGIQGLQRPQRQPRRRRTRGITPPASELDLLLIVQKNMLWSELPVDETVRMTVHERIAELQEDLQNIALFQRASFCYQIKELASSTQLTHLQQLSRCFLESDDIDHVPMTWQVGCGRDFLMKTDGLHSDGLPIEDAKGNCTSPAIADELPKFIIHGRR
mmetsp:Transcript_5759/g.12580  ORF Transcript_5759/g.12580 Transcript_5759/m.12580 type:complete len:165 (+) Transcript_5759:504-998(+)